LLKQLLINVLFGKFQKTIIANMQKTIAMFISTNIEFIDYDIVNQKNTKKFYRRMQKVTNINSSSDSEDEFGKTRYDPDDFDSVADLF